MSINGFATDVDGRSSATSSTSTATAPTRPTRQRAASPARASRRSAAHEIGVRVTDDGGGHGLSARTVQVQADDGSDAAHGQPSPAHSAARQLLATAPRLRRHDRPVRLGPRRRRGLRGRGRRSSQSRRRCRRALRRLTPSPCGSPTTRVRVTTRRHDRRISGARRSRPQLSSSTPSRAAADSAGAALRPQLGEHPRATVAWDLDGDGALDDGEPAAPTPRPTPRPAATTVRAACTQRHPGRDPRGRS